MSQAPQNYKNHTRLDPPFHFFLLPVVAIALVWCIKILITDPTLVTAWRVILALAAAVATVKIRTNALKAQDRVIRLEERMRLSAVLSEPLKSRIGELKEGQLIALRFASDGELQSLVEKTLSQQLKPKQIKQAIVNWRPDYFRV